jgi:hypothetical protein
VLRQAATANTARPVGVDLWLRCTPRHTALSSFGEALCRAVEAPEPSLSQTPRRRRRPGRVGRRGRVAAGPQEVALVVDDVHELPPGSDAARLPEVVVDSLPANGHVVLAGRSAPPFPLARREVEGHVVRLGQADLAFTPSELGEFAALGGVDRHRAGDRRVARPRRVVGGAAAREPAGALRHHGGASRRAAARPRPRRPTRDLAERTLVTDPWHEPAYRPLVATHHAGHDELAVRRALGRYCGIFHELGIDNPEAGAMARRLVDNLPPRRP